MQKEANEVEIYRRQVTELEKQANELTIASPEDNTRATELKAKLDRAGKEIKAKKESITKPINEALRNARELFAPLERMFTAADEIVGGKLLAYKRKIEADARAKEAKIAADLESGKIKKLETAERHIDKIERVEKTTNTNFGQVQFRKIQKMRVTDKNVESIDGAYYRTPKTVILDKYWVLDQVKLRKDVIAGNIVEGAEKYEEETV